MSGYRVLEEVECHECGKNFIPAPEHRFKIGSKYFCKWTCLLHYRNRINSNAERSAEEAIITIPCKIGDTVWAIRDYNGVRIAKKGKVSEMYFIEGMRLCICVKQIARGEWGKIVFATKEDCEKALRGRNDIRK